MRKGKKENQGERSQKPLVVADTHIILPGFCARNQVTQLLFDCCWRILVSDEIVMEYRKVIRSYGQSAEFVKRELEKFRQKSKLAINPPGNQNMLTHRERRLTGGDVTDHKFLIAAKIGKPNFIISNDGAWNREGILSIIKVEVIDETQALELLKSTKHSNG